MCSLIFSFIYSFIIYGSSSPRKKEFENKTKMTGPDDPVLILTANRTRRRWQAKLRSEERLVST